MKFTLLLTADDYIKARRLAMRPKPRLLYSALIVFGLCAISLIWQIVDGIESGYVSSGFWLMLGAGIYLYVIFYVWMPFSIRRVYKQQKTLQVPAEVEFTDTHFLATSPNGTFQMPWKDFHKWKRNDNMVLVYQSDAIMHIIHFRSFGSENDRERLFEILSQNLGKEGT